jgi:hypothetical protein
VADGIYQIKSDTIVHYRKGGNTYTVYGCDLLKQWPQLADGIVYRNGEPDFEPVRYKDAGDHFMVTVDFGRYRDSSNLRSVLHAEANRQVAEACGCAPMEVEKFMNNNQLTWHECSDGKTMVAVPTVLHDIFRHTGGVSVQGGLSRYQNYHPEIRDGRLVLVRQPSTEIQQRKRRM